MLSSFSSWSPGDIGRAGLLPAGPSKPCPELRAEFLSKTAANVTPHLSQISFEITKCEQKDPLQQCWNYKCLLFSYLTSCQMQCSWDWMQRKAYPACSLKQAQSSRAWNKNCAEYIVTNRHSTPLIWGGWLCGCLWWKPGTHLGSTNTTAQQNSHFHMSEFHTRV